jgi:serine/threonine-protein phosphatase 2A regulatory subunit B'
MGVYNPEEDDSNTEPSWPHLQVVYEFLLRLATSNETDSKTLAKFFTRRFVLNLLELFDSEDLREREYLKTILHRIYGNFMPLRPFIRRTINNVFFRFIYETDRHNGIAELLEILGSIINGFALPIKEQHKQFLSRVLLPLHKVTYVSVFHPQLSYCVTQFLEKDADLAPKIVHAVLKFWPLTNSKKELMFLSEIEEILDRIQSHNLGSAQVPLFTQIGRSINSPHFQVSERAIYVLNNDVLLRFVTSNRNELAPILSKALFANMYYQDPTKEEAEWRKLQRWQHKGHWNPSIKELTDDIIKLFNEMDQGLMDSCKANYEKDMERNVNRKNQRRLGWDYMMQSLPEETEEGKMN